MITLIFSIDRETFRVEIKDKEIYYLDRKMIRAVRLVPVDPKLNKRIIMSRNKLPEWIKMFYYMTEEEKKEYENCKTEEELSKVCVKDCESNGARLLKKEVENVQT